MEKKIGSTWTEIKAGEDSKSIRNTGLWIPITPMGWEIREEAMQNAIWRGGGAPWAWSSKIASLSYFSIKLLWSLGVVVHTCNPSSQEEEVDYNLKASLGDTAKPHLKKKTILKSFCKYPDNHINVHMFPDCIWAAFFARLTSTFYSLLSECSASCLWPMETQDSEERSEGSKPNLATAMPFFCKDFFHQK
jgi:hypothetical protein